MTNKADTVSEPQSAAGSDQPTRPAAGEAAQKERIAREKREASALRENLLRRKAQRRADPET